MAIKTIYVFPAQNNDDFKPDDPGNKLHVSVLGERREKKENLGIIYCGAGGTQKINPSHLTRSQDK